MRGVHREVKRDQITEGDSGFPNTFLVQSLCGALMLFEAMNLISSLLSASVTKYSCKSNTERGGHFTHDSSHIPSQSRRQELEVTGHITPTGKSKD